MRSIHNKNEDALNGAAGESGTHAARETFAARLSRQRWSIVAGVCLLVAGGCLVLSRMEAAFVAGTLGVVAWFWNERNRLRPASIEDVDEFEDEDEEIDERDEK